jgi:ADP-ribosyl-[dinitrogen reductase] hydrolase
MAPLTKTKGPPPRRKKGPPEASAEDISSRARGALLGLAVGDALGTTVEGKRLSSEMFPKLNEGPHSEMRGRGPFELKRGQVTDDTQLAACLAIGLRNHRRYDVLETAKEYARWVEHAFDCPDQLRKAIELVKEGKHPEFTGKRVWLESGQKARDNGALSRGVPLAVFFLWDQTARITASLEDAQISHFSPQCQLAGVIINAVIAAGITCPVEKLDKVNALKAIEAELSIGAAQLGRQHPDWVLQVKDASDWLREDIKASQDDDPLLYGPELHLHLYENWVRVTLRLALWELWHAPTLEAALIDVINRGGDADSNAAVAGALFGAIHGAAAIPERWSQDVLEVNGQGPLFNKYHPRELLTLVQNLPERPVKAPPGAPKK